VSKDPDEPNEGVTEVTLTPDGDQTILVFEHRDVTPDLLYAYGAGEQIHVEDLADYVAGRERRDAEARWNELEPLYRDLAADVGEALVSAKGAPRFISSPGSPNDYGARTEGSCSPSFSECHGFSRSYSRPREPSCPDGGYGRDEFGTGRSGTGRYLQRQGPGSLCGLLQRRCFREGWPGQRPHEGTGGHQANGYATFAVRTPARLFP
jgi:hypothetical protein